MTPSYGCSKGAPSGAKLCTEKGFVVPGTPRADGIRSILDIMGHRRLSDLVIGGHPPYEGDDDGVVPRADVIDSVENAERHAHPSPLPWPRIKAPVIRAITQRRRSRPARYLTTTGFSVRNTPKVSRPWRFELFWHETKLTAALKHRSQEPR